MDCLWNSTKRNKVPFIRQSGYRTTEPFGTSGAELGFESADPGKDPTTEPDLMMLWNVLDLTPEGCGTDWYPKVTY